MTIDKRGFPQLNGHWLGCLLSLQPRWNAWIEHEGGRPYLVKKQEVRAVKFKLTEIRQIQLRPGFLWSSIFLIGRSDGVKLPGIWRWRAGKIAQKIESQVVEEVERCFERAAGPLKKISDHVDGFLAQDRYLRNSDVLRFRLATYDLSISATEPVLDLLDHPYSEHISSKTFFRNRTSQIAEAMRPESSLIKQRNERFVATELEAHRAFFDSVEKSPLTDEQRRAAVIFEDRNLLVAAAGSGKSSTLVGKAGYAIQRGVYRPSEIIALAFNRDAASELNERINLRIKPWLNGQTVKAHTFHALGASIVRQVARRQGRKARIATEHDEKPRLQTVLTECLRSSEFLADWVLFLSLCREPIPADDSFNSFEDYERYVDQQRKARRNGEAAAFQALTGDVVNSAEELAIANWLYINGVPFEYERPFTPLPDAWDKYQPDFYYPEIDAWHEHFALDANGQAPAHFRDYAVNADFKRQWLTTHVPGRWFETRSHHHRDGDIFNRLKASLQSLGQPFQPRGKAEVLERIRQLGQTDALDLLLEVLHLVKGNGISPVTFEQLLASLHDQERGKRFAKIFWPLFNAYNQRLQHEGKIDFDDMIVQAAVNLEKDLYSSPYKLVLVDEFQDLSPGRARLIKALLGQHEDAVLFGVGDDWQAINGFAGSDLRLFMKFRDIFGPTHEGVLTRTFRCAQGIADVGAFFVQQNTQGQKAKQVISELDKTIKGVVDLVSVEKNDHVSGELEHQLDSIAATHATLGSLQPNSRKATVFLLSRYGLNKTKELPSRWLDAAKTRYKGVLDIEFMTMHKSKGLEADYVFLLGLNAGWGLTFPSMLTNDPLVDMLLANRDSFLHAEERRLFYVALTRAKKKATILFRQFNPSPFVLELMEPRYHGRVTYRGAELPQRCDRCGKGFLIQRTGPYGPFMGCTRYSSSYEGCRNTKKVFQRTSC